METWCCSRIGSLPAVRLQADNCGRVARSPDCQQVTRNHERLTDIHESCLFISVKLKQFHGGMYDTAHIFIGISYGGGRGNPVRTNESESRNYLVLSSVQPPKISLTEALLSPLHYGFFFLKMGNSMQEITVQYPQKRILIFFFYHFIHNTHTDPPSPGKVGPFLANVVSFRKWNLRVSCQLSEPRPLQSVQVFNVQRHQTAN